MSATEENTSNALYKEEYHPAWLPALALAFPVLPLFWNYHVLVTKTELSIGYSTSLVAKTMPTAAIETAEPVEISPLWQWGGWGLRLRYSDGGWQTGYISQGGPGVKVVLKEKDKESVYVFSCNEPKTVCDLLSP